MILRLEIPAFIFLKINFQAKLNFKLGWGEVGTSTKHHHTRHSHFISLIRFFKGIPKVAAIHRMGGKKMGLRYFKTKLNFQSIYVGRKISLCNSFEAFGEQKGNFQ